jgi:hypothetical protein
VRDNEKLKLATLLGSDLFDPFSYDLRGGDGAAVDQNAARGLLGTVFGQETISIELCWEFKRL